MKDINRLIKKAKSVAIGAQLGSIIAFIEFDSDKAQYVSSCHLWSGIIGDGCSVLANEHDTLEAADQYVKSIIERHPSKGRPIVFYDLFDEEEL
jgi:hypothetical protein